MIRNKWMYDDRASEREWKSKEGGTEGGREREREREREGLQKSKEMKTRPGPRGVFRQREFYTRSKQPAP